MGDRSSHTVLAKKFRKTFSPQRHRGREKSCETFLRKPLVSSGTLKLISKPIPLPGDSRALSGAEMHARREEEPDIP